MLTATLAPQIQGFTESCYGKTAMAGVAGFGLGALFGMFMASVGSPPTTKPKNRGTETEVDTRAADGLRHAFPHADGHADAGDGGS